MLKQQRQIATVAVGALCCVTSLVLASAWANGSSKVTICHIPTGNPEKQQTIAVSESALDAHLAHGDFLGMCESAPSSCTDAGGLCFPAGPCSDGSLGMLDCGLGQVCCFIPK